MTSVQKYIVTGSNYPEWFMNGSKQGLIKVVNDEDGNFSHIVIESPSGRKYAKKNDVVIKTRSGYSVLTGEQAKKYKVDFVPKRKVEVKEEDEVDE